MIIMITSVIMQWIRQAWPSRAVTPVKPPFPGTERLRKLLSVGPYGYVFSQSCSKCSDNP